MYLINYLFPILINLGHIELFIFNLITYFTYLVLHKKTTISGYALN